MRAIRLAERKFGMDAKHLNKRVGVAKKTAASTNANQQRDARKTKSSTSSVNTKQQRNAGKTKSAVFTTSSRPSQSAALDEKLHPSWAAKKNQKIGIIKNPSVKGTKVVYDDDD